MTDQKDEDTNDPRLASLTPMQFKVTQQCGTEPAFQNEFWDHHESGIYVDIVSGEPLFASVHKFDSGTGWPSFTRPIVAERIVEHEDTAWGMRRVEVRSKEGDSHSGMYFLTAQGPRDSATASTRRLSASYLRARCQQRGTATSSNCSRGSRNDERSDRRSEQRKDGSAHSGSGCDRHTRRRLFLVPRSGLP